MPTIMADVNIRGHVDLLMTLIQAEPWHEFWEELETTYVTFADVGLADTASDAEIWQVCQQHEIVLLTNNRNRDGPDSLTAAIQSYNTPESLPVLTIGNADEIWYSREYADRVIESLLDVLDGWEDLRGTGRLFLPWSVQQGK